MWRPGRRGRDTGAPTGFRYVTNWASQLASHECVQRIVQAGDPTAGSGPQTEMVLRGTCDSVPNHHVRVPLRALDWVSDVHAPAERLS